MAAAPPPSSDKRPIIIVKKKIAGHAGHHGGAWKVAYADFVTAMMCFFLVMWLMSSDSEVVESAEDFFANPNASFKADSEASDAKYVGGNTGDGDHMLHGLTDGLMPEDLKKVPRLPFSELTDPKPDYATNLKEVSEVVQQTENVDIQNLVFLVPEDFLFKPDSVDFRPKAFDYLKNLGTIAKKQRGKLTIEGFAGRDKYEFMTARVVSVMAYLVKNKAMEQGRISPVIKSLEDAPTQDHVLRLTFSKNE